MKIIDLSRIDDSIIKNEFKQLLQNYKYQKFNDSYIISDEDHLDLLSNKNQEFIQTFWINRDDKVLTELELKNLQNKPKNKK